MESVGDNNQNAVRGRKVLVISKVAPACFLCDKSFASMKYLYRHISVDHSNSEWKTFLALHNTTTIDVVSGHLHNLDQAKAVEYLSAWKATTGKRGSPGLKLANDRVEEIDEKSRQAAEDFLFLVRGHLAPSKAAEPSVDGGCMVGHDHPSMAEPTVEQKLMQDEDNDFKGRYKMVHDFDLNLDPTSTAMEDEDI